MKTTKYNRSYKNKTKKNKTRKRVRKTKLQKGGDFNNDNGYRTNENRTIYNRPVKKPRKSTTIPISSTHVEFTDSDINLLFDINFNPYDLKEILNSLKREIISTLNPIDAQRLKTLLEAQKDPNNSSRLRNSYRKVHLKSPNSGQYYEANNAYANINSNPLYNEIVDCSSVTNKNTCKNLTSCTYKPRGLFSKAQCVSNGKKIKF